MSLGLKNAQLLVGLITLFLAYLFTIAPAGCFRAWVAKKMGDSTAEDAGLLTINPIPHIDLFGVIWLLLFSQPGYFSGFGWGKYIPINPHNIRGNRRWLKIICAYFSDSFAHLIMAAVALAVPTLIFGGPVLTVGMVKAFSFSLVIFQLLHAFVGLNIALLLVQAIINAVILTALYFSEGNAQSSSNLYYFVLLAPIMILFLLGPELYQLMFYIISALSKVFCYCI